MKPRGPESKYLPINKRRSNELESKLNEITRAPDLELKSIDGISPWNKCELKSLPMSVRRLETTNNIVLKLGGSSVGMRRVPDNDVFEIWS